MSRDEKKKTLVDALRSVARVSVKNAEELADCLLEILKVGK